MVTLEFNGRPFDPKTFHDQIMAGVLEQLVSHIRGQVAGIRDPDTGEFPTVLIRAMSLSDMTLQVEGSDYLIARVRDVLGLEGDEPSPDASPDVEPPPDEGREGPIPPKVFLSYASEDRELASQLAHALMSQGIDVWWDAWEIRAGDSLRRKIDAGLADCTHFLVLLTQTSLAKAWVNQEMDTGFVRMLNDRIVFLAVRVGLPAESLPPLLRGLHSPQIDDVATDVRQLAHDIHGITRKPPVGPRPTAASTAVRTGVSPAATALARVFVEQTKNALGYDPQFSRVQLEHLTGLSSDDLSDAIYELRGRITLHDYAGGGVVVAEPSLYSEFDGFFQPWQPADDALRLAADIHNDSGFPSSPREIAARYGWSPRRLNPALVYLHDRELIEVSTGLGDATYLGYRVCATDATRRFVKSRTLGNG